MIKIKKILNTILNIPIHNKLLVNAIRGFPNSQLELAKFYLIEKENYVEAYAWAEVAYLRHHPGALQVKQLAEVRLVGQQIKEAWDKAREYKISFT